jgi:hypothetical protein
VIAINTNIKNNKTFWTDSNGLQMQKRILNHRETWDLKVKNLSIGCRVRSSQLLPSNFFNRNRRGGFECVSSERPEPGRKFAERRTTGTDDPPTAGHHRRQRPQRRFGRV